MFPSSLKTFLQEEEVKLSRNTKKQKLPDGEFSQTEPVAIWVLSLQSLYKQVLDYLSL